VIEVGDRVKILSTGTYFLEKSVGKIGIVIGVNRADENCLVELSDKYCGYNNRQWHYRWDELEVIK
jgi:hypothetical protein